MINKQSLIDRFLRYVAIDTQSDDTVSDRFPSTEKQLVLSNLLVKELKELGVSDATIDEFGYVMGTIPANSTKKVPVIGFLAHVDTSPDMPGKNVKPRFVESYDGSDITLNAEKGVILSAREFPELKEYTGQTLIVTDGTTLLGADDKAGIAEIMTAVEYITGNPTLRHGKIRIGFTVDEEVGRGVDHFDVKRFGADYAYTLDGGAVGELEFENFNAASAKITIQGRNIHPGYAKDKMLHITKIEGTVEKASFQYIIRDHDMRKFERRKAYMERVTRYLNSKYGDQTVTLEINDQYYNMREKVEPVYHVVQTAIEAMEKVGIKPKVRPIRGGTDGARLSYMGLPCPNLFAGGENFHGKHEYVPVESMVKATETILKIVEIYESR